MSVSRVNLKRIGFVVTLTFNGAPLGRVHGSQRPRGVLAVRKTAEIFPDLGAANRCINATIEHHRPSGGYMADVHEFRVSPVGTWT